MSLQNILRIDATPDVVPPPLYKVSKGIVDARKRTQELLEEPKMAAYGLMLTREGIGLTADEKIIAEVSGRREAADALKAAEVTLSVCAVLEKNDATKDLGKKLKKELFGLFYTTEKHAGARTSDELRRDLCRAANVAVMQALNVLETYWRKTKDDSIDRIKLGQAMDGVAAEYGNSLRAENFNPAFVQKIAGLLSVVASPARIKNRNPIPPLPNDESKWPMLN